MKYNLFIEELSKRKNLVYEYLNSQRFRQLFTSEHIQDSVYSYINQSGKSLRPSVLLLSCSAVGGDESVVIPAAAAIEVFHTWTIVHDDIIDRDDKRRGGFTVHEEFRKKAINDLGYDEDEAKHYGTSIAILAGDMQQGLAVSMLSELGDPIDPKLVLYLIKDMELRIESLLIDGQFLDIRFSKLPIESLNLNQILDMLWKKTGVLYEFCGKAGAMLGLNTIDCEHPYVKALSSFASKCGLAFQLQDDILGIIGNEKILGKPVGSDIKEGKRTTILAKAFSSGNKIQKKQIMEIFGNTKVSSQDIEIAKKLLLELGGIEYTKDLARSYIKEAFASLNNIPTSKYRDLLSFWAEYMIEREF